MQGKEKKYGNIKKTSVCIEFAFNQHLEHS